jgi:TPP-dependent pyruvate/acetoin dehydrogenase alpha subunit
MQPDDYIVPYYRDRALVLGRGVASRELALDYMAKRTSQSGGRQMPSHYSYADRHIWSVPTPTGSQLCPPAVSPGDLNSMENRISSSQLSVTQPPGRVIF